LKKNGTIVPIVPYSLPYFVGRFTIRGDGRGVINDGRGLSERLQWLGRRHLQPLRLAWARAGQAAWSPRGQWIADYGNIAWIDNSRLLAAVPRKTHRQRAGLEELQLTNLSG